MVVRVRKVLAGRDRPTFSVGCGHSRFPCLSQDLGVAAHFHRDPVRRSRVSEIKTMDAALQ
jgi:hypothetical protein